MGARKVQTSFAAGELAPSMYGRFDDQKYQQGLARCRNFIVLPQGPATLRTGTAFVNAAKFSDRPCRVIPFTFSAEQTLAIELGDKYARFHTRGKTLLTETGEVYEIETPYTADDVKDIHYVQSMDVMTLVHPNYPPKELRRYGATDWRMVDVKFGTPLEPPTTPKVEYKVVASSGVTITNDEKTRYTLKYKVTAVKETDTGKAEESSPSEIGSVQGNLYLQNATCTLTWDPVIGAERYRVYKNFKGLYCFIGETTETSFVDDNYSPDEGITPPIYDDPFLTAKAIREVTVADGGSGYRPTDYGEVEVKEYDLPSRGLYLGKQDHSTSGYPYLPGKVEADIVDLKGNGTGAKAELVATASRRWTKTAGGHGENDTYSIYYVEVTYGKLRILSGGRGYVAPALEYYKAFDKSYEPLDLEPAGAEIVIEDTTGRGADVVPVIQGGAIAGAIIRSGGQGYTAPKAKVIAKHGTGAKITLSTGTYGDYPGAVCYYEQRRCFAGTSTRPQMVWMTRSGTESDMSYTLPAQDDNRLRFAIAAQEASRILHLTPIQQMLALTNTTEYRVFGGGSQPMAPDAIRSEVQAQVGASNVMPVVVNSTVVYAAARGGHIRELGYNWQASGFATGDLSIRSAHFFEEASVAGMALAKSPDPIVWVAMSDGSLLGFTYLPEQAIGGWHKHTTVNGRVESITVVPEGEEDILYCVVHREINGKNVRYIERMHERKLTNLEDAWHVDCGGEYRGPQTTEVSGLTWLEGQTVSIFADGCVLPQRVVKDGKVSLTQPSGHVIVGLPIVADLQTLPVAISMNDGSYGNGHMKNVNDVFVRVHKSSGLFVGPDFDNLVEVKQRADEPYGAPPALMSREVSVAALSRWSDSGQICIRQKDPLPLTIVSMTWDLAR